MGDYDVGDLGPEDPTSYPAPGELLLYPGGVSEVEILFPYGDTCFASKAGQLAGNHFATVVEGLEHLPAIGELVLWEGAQDIVFSGWSASAATERHHVSHPGARILGACGRWIHHLRADALGMSVLCLLGGVGAAGDAFRKWGETSTRNHRASPVS